MLNKTEIQKALLNSKALEVKEDESYFVWTSGIHSPIYCDNRLLLSYPQEREAIIDSFVSLIEREKLDCDVIAGVATAGIPWASFIAQRLNKPMVFVRQKPKEHGKKSQIEGIVRPGQKVLVVEDLISTGKSSAAVIRVLKDNGINVSSIISVFTYGLDKSSKVFDEVEVRPYSLVSLPDFFESSVLTEETSSKIKTFWNKLNQ